MYPVGDARDLGHVAMNPFFMIYSYQLVHACESGCVNMRLVYDTVCMSRTHAENIGFATTLNYCIVTGMLRIFIL